MGNYYQKEIETASREEILRIQNEKIVKQVKHVYESVPYYRDLSGAAFWKEIGWKKSDVNYYEFVLNEKNITRFIGEENEHA